MNSTLQRSILLGHHHRYNSKGQYILARRLLQFLNNERIHLGVCDVDLELEHLFEQIGLKPCYINWRSGAAVYKLDS